MQTKVCSKCGDRMRFTDYKRWICDPCNRARAKAYRLANLEMVREKDRIRVAKMSPQAKRDKHKRWRDANIEHVRAYGRETMSRMYQRNPEKFRNRSRRYHQENREKCLAVMAQRRETLTDSYIRTVLHLNASVSVPQSLIDAKRIQLQITRLLRERRA